MNERLEQIGERIRTQDNRITADPLFAVQQKVRDYGFNEDYASDYIWRNNRDCETSTEYDPEKQAELDAQDDMGILVEGEWSKVYYRERWEFVTACFTEQGCKDYITLDGHNLGESRIYAYSAYRNKEFQDVRQAIIDGVRHEAKEGAGDDG